MFRHTEVKQRRCLALTVLGLVYLLVPARVGFAQSLTSITVTPANPEIRVGNAQQFTATGNFSDGSTRVLGGSAAGRIDAGAFHACVVLSDGTARCWGRNTYGQLGNGTTTTSSTPVPVSGISTATAIGAGGSSITGDTAHSCARLSDRTMRCWGNNGSGQLGNGTTTTSSTPVPVSGIGTATAIAVGGGHSCAVLSDGTARCWGNNIFGQLGNGTNQASSTPVQVKGIGGATAITAGAYHTCARLSNGRVKCWGRQDSGQLGNGVFRNERAPFTAQYEPVDVIGISTATAIIAGDVHNCALLSDGRMQCWGSNFAGGLGDGTTTNAATPVDVIGISTATAIAAGTYHSCAMLSDGSMMCWGGNYFGALGNGTTGNGTDAANSTTPVPVIGISTATVPTAGGLFTCTILSDGTVRCWGSNFYGQLGDGTNTDSSTPVQVSGITTAGAPPSQSAVDGLVRNDHQPPILLLHGTATSVGPGGSWNRGAERIFGFTAAEAIGQQITLIIPEDRRGEEDDVLARLRRGERIDHFETVRTRCGTSNGKGTTPRSWLVERH